MAYALHAQKDRRNLTDGEFLGLVSALDKRRNRGGDRRSKDARSTTSSEVSDPSSQATAKLIGTSATKVEKARAVLDSKDEALRAKVEAGEISLNRAASTARAAKRPPADDSAVRAKAVVRAARCLSDAEHGLRPYEPEIADRIGEGCDA